MKHDPAPRDLGKLVEAALARHGSAGRVQVGDGRVSLVGSGPTVSVDVHSLLARWEQLPYSERQLECAAVAKELSMARRPVPAVTSGGGSRPFGLLVALGVLLAAAALYWKRVDPTALFSMGNPASRHPTEPAVEQDPEAARQARAERVCSATRTRVLRGATVGPTDVEGWEVRLSLIHEGQDPGVAGLAEFVDPRAADGHGRIVWTGSPELSALSGFATGVEVVNSAHPADAPRYREVELRLRGGYVTPYFRERQRIQLVRFANALARRQKALLGGLYASCAGGTSHHLGSWFLGGTPGEAAASLAYFMGAHAAPPQLPQTVLSPQAGVDLNPAHALSALLAAAAHLKRQDVASLIGNQDGMVAVQDGFTTLRFPFVDSNRALRASRGIARAMRFE